MTTNDEWYTPKEIITSLGSFDLDPATSQAAYSLNQSAKHYYTKENNGLFQNWFGRVWLNPPYSNPLIQKFLIKMGEHNNGIALVFSKVEAKWFHDIVFAKACAIKFLYNRVKFLRPDGSVGAQPRNGSMLVAYGKENGKALILNSLKGRTFIL